MSASGFGEAGIPPASPTGTRRPYTSAELPGGVEMDEYVVAINGVEHTMLLDAEDAERYGDNATKVSSTSTKQAKPPANKGRDHKG